MLNSRSEADMNIDPRIQLRADYARHKDRPFFQKHGPTAAAEAQKQALDLGWLCIHRVMRGKNLLAITPAGIAAIGAAASASAPMAAPPPVERPVTALPPAPRSAEPPRRSMPMPVPMPMPASPLAPVESEILDTVLRAVHRGDMSADEAVSSLTAAGFPAAVALREIELFLTD